jgi:hypothetical protein
VTATYRDRSFHRPGILRMADNPRENPADSHSLGVLASNPSGSVFTGVTPRLWPALAEAKRCQRET